MEEYIVYRDGKNATNQPMRARVYVATVLAASDIDACERCQHELDISLYPGQRFTAFLKSVVSK